LFIQLGDNLEQQVLLRLAFMADETTQCTFKVKDPTQQFFQQSNSLVRGPHLILLEEMFYDQVTVEGKAVTNTFLALELVKKLEALDLVSEEKM